MFFRQWLHDLRLTLRYAGRAKAFYISAILTLTMGMAGTTVIFALVRGILLRPLPVPDEDRLVVSWRVPRTGMAAHVPYRSADVLEIGRTSRSFEHVAGVSYNGAFEQEWRDGDRSFAAKTSAVMGGFFDVAGVRPYLGRGLAVDDDRHGAERLLVLSHGTWQRLFAGSPDVIGRRLHFDDHPFTIAGVMPADFQYPHGVEIWTTPHALAAVNPNEDFRVAMLRDVEFVARLRDGVTIRQAEDELAALTATLDGRGSTSGFVDFRPVVRPFKDVIVGEIDSALVVLLAAVGFLLAVAAANVANLLLMRGEGRRAELAVRAALGASRGRLVGHIAAESLMIGIPAGVAALALAHLTLPAVVTLVPDGLPRLDSVRIDAAVVAFTIAAVFVTAALAGMVPALALSRLDLVSCLRAGGRGSTGSVSARGRRALVAAQVALAVTVIAAAGLLARSLQRLQTVDMGMASDRLVLATLDLPTDAYSDQARRRQFFETVLQRVQAMPGVDAATPLNTPPYAGALGWDLPRFTVEGQTADRVAANPSLNFDAVHPSYFSAIGIAILRGRAFTANDRAGQPPVAIVSDAVAAAAWPGQDPIGKRLKYGCPDSRNEWLTVIGVAATTRYRELVTPRPTLYVPAEQMFISFNLLAIRTSLDEASVSGHVRDIVRAADASVRVRRVARYTDFLRGPLAWPRFNTVVLTIFAGSALLLSAIGLYGVMAASVRQRQGEIGLRLAIGATARDVRRLVLGEGLRLTLAGLVLGLALALVVTRALRGLLFEIQPLDPVSLGAASLVLAAAAIAVCWMPARRASRVDPIEALRTQ